MASFCKAEDLEKRYVVTAQCLFGYARRGNLSMHRLGNELLFDEDSVARLFRRRELLRDGGPGESSALGVLGARLLGVSNDVR
jgi:hypothetical protein